MAKELDGISKIIVAALEEKPMNRRQIADLLGEKGIFIGESAIRARLNSLVGRGTVDGSRILGGHVEAYNRPTSSMRVGRREKLETTGSGDARKAGKIVLETDGKRIFRRPEKNGLKFIVFEKGRVRRAMPEEIAAWKSRFEPPIRKPAAAKAMQAKKPAMPRRRRRF